MQSSQPTHMDRLARVLRTLKRGIGLLCDACRKLRITEAAVQYSAPAVASPPVRDPSLQLPYLLRPEYGFGAAEALTPVPWNRVYVAEHEQYDR